MLFFAKQSNFHANCCNRVLAMNNFFSTFLEWSENEQIDTTLFDKIESLDLPEKCFYDDVLSLQRQYLPYNVHPKHT